MKRIAMPAAAVAAVLALAGCGGTSAPTTAPNNPVPRELLEHDMGPALVIDQRRDAMRLDHYLVEHGAELDLPARLEMIRRSALLRC